MVSVVGGLQHMVNPSLPMYEEEWTGAIASGVTAFVAFVFGLLDLLNQTPESSRIIFGLCHSC